MKSGNSELELANAFVQSTGSNLFLTGKAGTGKTTFLKNIKQTCPKRLVVTAPTGVAAINAGGVTLHSFFQIPFGPYVPDSEGYNQSNRHRFSREKQNIIKSLDLLIIDEISMVRADMLDAVDAVLRRYRRNEAPFGGVQLLAIGDLQQLAPVVKESDRSILNQFYESPYFFSSNSLRSTRMFTIELKKIYRQSDDHFIELLNKVRDNNLDPAAQEELNKRYQPDFQTADTSGYITLCTHNRQADRINEARLEALSGKAYSFTAEIDGEFPEHSFPTAATLDLKSDAQVMFIRNDPTPEKRFYNGKIGRIVAMNNDEITVQCPGDAYPIVIKPSVWENIEYILDVEEGEVREKKKGSFSQHPLRLAWAITIHKSQGLTFERAIIDAQAAFTHGQVYVALSRCRTLEGVVLSSPIAGKSIQTDAAVLNFVRQAQEEQPTQQQLKVEQNRYQQRLLLECFNFKPLRSVLHRFVSTLGKFRTSLVVIGVEDVLGMCHPIWDEICSVGDNFQRQLEGFFQENNLPEQDPVILERLNKASGYFDEKLVMLFITPFQQVSIETDNKEIRKTVTNILKRLHSIGAEKLAAVQSCKDGFSPQQYLRSISAAAVEAPPQKKQKVSSLYLENDVAHPKLFEKLKQWRTQKAAEEDLLAYQVLHQKTLVQIAVYLPITITDLKAIKGIGNKLAERYGEEIVTLIGDYRKDHDINEVVLPAKPEPKETDEPSGKTKDQTLSLFEQGLTIEEISGKRSLTKSTIEGHLAFWVAEGKIAVNRLVADDKREQIEKALQQEGGKSFREVKEILGGDVSYGEIKIVQASLKSQDTGGMSQIE
jgi:DNA-directed RNA polymerase subunit F